MSDRGAPVTQAIPGPAAGRIHADYGSGVLDMLSDLEPDTPPHEDGDGDRERIPIGGAYADVPLHTLWVWDEESRNPLFLEEVAHAWSSRHLKTHNDGLAHQMVLSGRDPSLVTVPQEQMVAELLRELFGDHGFDPKSNAHQLDRRSR